MSAFAGAGVALGDALATGLALTLALELADALTDAVDEIERDMLPLIVTLTDGVCDASAGAHDEPPPGQLKTGDGSGTLTLKSDADRPVALPSALAVDAKSGAARAATAARADARLPFALSDKYSTAVNVTMPELAL